MVSANFSYDSDFSKVTKEIQNLVREATQANTVFTQLNKTAAAAKMEAARSFAGQADAAGFKTTIVDLTGATENFGQALAKNKLTMKQYFSEAAKAYKKDSQAYRLALREVRRSQSSVVSMGDIGGRRKGLLITPDSVDVKDLQTKMAIASKRYEIFNDLVNKGATSLINWGKNTQWAGRQLTVGLTVPMTIFSTKALQAFATVDKEITRFIKVYGSDLPTTVYDSTEVILGQVRGLGEEFAKQYGIASSQTIALAADLASAGLEGQNLVNAVNQTTRMMVLGEIDRQQAMKATLSLQTAFNMNSKELAQSIDYLNQVENQTSASLQDLTEAIPKAGPVIQALGGDIKDLSVLMTALREGGIASAEGANALKSGMASLISPTTKATEVAKQFGIDLEGVVKRNKGELMPMLLDFQDQLRGLDDFGKAKVIEEIFGKYQFARISALFDNLNQRGSQTVGMIQLMNKSADDLAKQSYSELQAQQNAPSTRLAAMQQQMTEQLVKIGADLAETVVPVLEQGLGILSSIVDGFNNLPTPLKNFVKILGAIVSVSGPILMLGGMFGNFIGNAIKFGMSIVNMFKRITGHPVQALQILSDEEMAAKIAAEQLSGAYYRQKTSVDALNKSLTTYLSLLRQSAAVAPTGTVLPGGRGPLPPVRRRHGGIIYAQNGMTEGQINGYGGGDKVPALLEPGEFVINKESSKKFAPMLREINNGTYGQFSVGKTDKIPGEPLNLDAPERPTVHSKATNILYQKPSKDTTLAAFGKAPINQYNQQNMLPSDIEATKKLLAEIKQVSKLKTDISSWSKQGYLNVPTSIANTPIGKLARNLNDIIQVQKWMIEVEGTTQGMSSFMQSASHAVGGGTPRLVQLADGTFGMTDSKNFMLTTRLEPQIANQQIQKFGEISLDKIKLTGAGAYQGVLDKLAGIQHPELLKKRDSLARLLTGTGSAVTYSDAVLMSDFYDELERNPALRQEFVKESSIATGKKYYNELKKLGIDGFGRMTKSQWITSQISALGITGNDVAKGLADIVGKPGAKPQNILIDDIYKTLEEAYDRSIGSVLAEEAAMIREEAKKKAITEQQAARSRKAEDIARSRRTAEQKLIQESARVEAGALSEAQLAKLKYETFGDERKPNRWYATGVDGNTIKLAGEPMAVDAAGNKYIETSHGLIAIDRDGNPILDSQGRVKPITPGSINVNKIKSATYIARPKKSGTSSEGYKFSRPLEVRRKGEISYVRDYVTGRWKFLQKGGQLPGYGGGDSVPAMLEPGEFVINKEATKQNKTLLEGINNGNVQKKRNGGIIRGYAGGGQVLGQSAGVLMNLSFLPMMYQMAEETEGTMGKVLKAVVVIQGIVAAMQVAQLAGGIGKGIAGKLATARAPRSLISVGADGVKNFGSVKGGALNAMKGQGAKAVFTASRAGGAGMMTSLGAAAGTALVPVLAVSAAVAAIGVGLYMWRQRVDEIAKGTADMYGEATEMAKVYNIELNKTSEAYSKLQKAAASLGQATIGAGKGQIDKDYAKAVTKDYGDAINRIKEMYSQQDKLNGITSIYTSLITQGFSAEQAKEITAEVARQADATQSLNSEFSMMAAKVGEDIPTAMRTMVEATIEVVASVAEIEAQVEALNGTWENLVRVAAQEPLEFQANVQTLFTTVGETNPQSVKQMMQTQIDNMGLGGTDSAANQVLSGIALGTEKGRLAGADFMNALVNQMDPTFIQEHWDAATQSFDAEFYAELQLNIGMNESKKELDKQMQKIIDDTEKQIDATNAYYDKQIDGIEAGIKAEEKAHDKVMENIQKQSDALQKKRDIIEENADFYIKQLEKEYQAESYYQKQRETAIGGLQSLSQGDIFGYLKAQQQSASDAAQFGREQAIQQIEDTKDLALKSIDGQMKANQEVGDAAQKSFDDNIQKKRDTIESLNKARSLAVKGLKDYIEIAQSVIDKQPGDDAAKDLQKLEDKGLEVAKIVPPKVKEALVASSVNIVENFDTTIKDVTQRLASQYGLKKDEAYALYLSLLGIQNPEIKRPQNISPGTWKLITGGQKQTKQILGGDTDANDFANGDSGNRRKSLIAETAPLGRFVQVKTDNGYEVYEWNKKAGKYQFKKIYKKAQAVMSTTQANLQQYLNRGGTVKPMKYRGGVVGVPGFGYSDKVPAMLTPGETVVDKIATQRNKVALAAMNAGVSFDRPNTNSYGSLAESEKEVYNNTVNMGGINININGSNLSAEQLQKSVLNALNKATSSIQTNLGGK